MTDTPIKPKDASDSAALSAALTVFMLVKTRPEWLELPEAKRSRLLREHVEPILRKYRGQVSLRLYDTEFYSSVVTDVWMWDATRPMSRWWKRCGRRRSGIASSISSRSFRASRTRMASASSGHRSRRKRRPHGRPRLRLRLSTQTADSIETLLA